MRLILASEESKRARDELTYGAWGARLTLSQFLKREERLRTHAWARETMRTWLLESKSGEILSSCETFRMDSRVVGNGGQTLLGATYGIASVFTEERLRGRGHASAMLELIERRLAAEDRLVQALILFSEVGEGLYARAGFAALESYERMFKSASRKSGGGGAARLLSEGEALELFGKRRPYRATFAVNPTVAQMGWHLERERIYAELLGRDACKARGVVWGDSFLLWMADHKNDALQTLHFEARTALEGQALIVRACEAAREMGLGRLRIWESEAFTGWERLGVFSERVSRDGALAMIKTIDRTVRPEHWTVVSRSTWV